MISATDIEKSFSLDGKRIPVLQGVSLHIDKGDFVSIIGRSGSGKSTLLNVLSTLVRPDSGELNYKKENLTLMKERKLNKIRETDFSIVFQFHHLLPYLTVLENTLLSFMGTIKPISKDAKNKAFNCLERVGLADKSNRLPGILSGGEQQRVAIARALVKSSKVLFADEPTGSLDKKTGEGIMTLLADLHKEGLAIIMVTHEMEYAKYGRRVIELEDGSIISEETY